MGIAQLPKALAGGKRRWRELSKFLRFGKSKGLPMMENMRSTERPLSLRIWQLARDTAVAWARIFHLGAMVWVLLLSPSTYRWHSLQPILQRMYRDTLPILLGFTVLAALICLVIT